MGAAFTATSGRDTRALCRWIARAITSLPVPDSPVIRTVASVRAAFPISLKTSRIVGCCPMSPDDVGSTGSEGSPRSRATSCCRRPRMMARVAVRSTSSGSNGFVM